jgi:diaminopimelate decarboxylase
MPSSDGLVVGGRGVAAIASQYGTPLYLYDGARIREQIATLQGTLRRFGASRIYYAMKANRCAAVLDLVRAQGIGIDACSPAEVALARSAGFAPQQISVTASSLSSIDLLALAKAGVHTNFDYVPAALGFSELTGHHGTFGLRIDAGQDAGYGARTNYGGGKLGIAAEDVVAAAIALAHEGAEVITLHTNLGWGLRAADEAAFRRAMTLLAELAQQIPSIRTFNVGAAWARGCAKTTDPCRSTAGRRRFGMRSVTATRLPVSRARLWWRTLVCSWHASRRRGTSAASAGSVWMPDRR